MSYSLLQRDPANEQAVISKSSMLLFSDDMGVNRDVVYNFILLCFCQLTESEKIINYSRQRGNWEHAGGSMSVCQSVNGVICYKLYKF